ncbi:MAG: PD40 domain-containing protein, partial [Phycisphaerales bacterium]|nr:PD40 domain-containing protein [Phycisphaerales bacterium]
MHLARPVVLNSVTQPIPASSFGPRRLSFVLGAALCGIALTAPALSGVTGYYRFPTIHGDRVVFAAEGDLWQVAIGGGMASRITTHPGNEAFAKFSPDGKWLAFSAEYEGNVDAYVMPADGGEPLRLTFHPLPDEIIAWRADSSAIVFRSRRESPNRDLNIFEVPRTGGQPRKFAFGACALADFAPDGKRIAFVRFSWETRTWKRYTGGTAQDVWIGDLETNKFSRMTTWDGTDAFPMWVGDRVYYASDRSSTMNIFSARPDGSDIKQITEHADYDVRWPDSDGKSIIYMQAGDLWLVDSAGGKPRKLDIQLPTDRIRQRERVENAAATIEHFDLDKDGKRLIVGSRGELWTTPTKPGRIVQVTDSSGARERLGAISPDGKHIAC